MDQPEPTAWSLLDHRAKIWRRLGQPASLDDYTLKYGQTFAPDRLFDPIGAPKNCFANAGRIALSDARFNYCEGFAISTASIERNYPFLVHHAWVIDPDGVACETTWPDGANSYFGIQFSQNHHYLALEKYDQFDVLELIAREALTTIKTSTGDDHWIWPTS